MPHGLPRTRGDGPLRAIYIGTLAPAPPHTRGWTPCRPVANARPDGSPAHAGMDLAEARVPPLPLRLPRTRGMDP